MNSISVSDKEASTEYKRRLHTLISTAYNCFEQGNLSSLSCKADEFTADEYEYLLLEIEELINKNIFDSIVRYKCCQNEYWELSDGVADICICLHTKDNKATVKIDYFDSRSQ